MRRRAERAPKRRVNRKAVDARSRRQFIESDVAGHLLVQKIAHAKRGERYRGAIRRRRIKHVAAELRQHAIERLVARQPALIVINGEKSGPNRIDEILVVHQRMAKGRLNPRATPEDSVDAPRARPSLAADTTRHK